MTHEQHFSSIEKLGNILASDIENGKLVKCLETFKWFNTHFQSIITLSQSNPTRFESLFYDSVNAPFRDYPFHTPIYGMQFYSNFIWKAYSAAKDRKYYEIVGECQNVLANIVHQLKTNGLTDERLLKPFEQVHQKIEQVAILGNL